MSKEFSISVAGLKYRISSLTDDFYFQRGKDFECQKSNDDFRINVTEDALKNFSLYNPEFSLYNNETTYILDKVVRHCLDYNRMIIHGAAIKYEDSAILFIAPSGTGKTTHINLWKKYLMDNVTIINGDKPMLDFDSNIKVHGTPWKGKEDYGENGFAPLKAIVVIKQDKINSFNRLDINEALSFLIGASFYSTDEECGPKIAPYLGEIINHIPIYELKCDVSLDAFKTCYRGLTKKEYNG